ncbi:MAG: cell wall-binding repeat-containing protein, partial [Coriobacteriia bacterium]|nr:cell wall-binding repeat-containing protein [Coriobacteriia bacterium]
PDFAPDAYEPDDTAVQAKTITTNGVPQEHTFHLSGDVDWVKFDAVAGNTYVIETFQGDAYGVDTLIELYDDPTDMPVDYDDDGGTDDWCSKISWAASKDAVMYVRVCEYDDDVGAYRISVTEQDTVARVYGADRFQTAIEASKRNFKFADAIIMATGMNYADALSASALAGALEAPLLLTKPDALSNGVLQEANRLGAAEVYIIGSTAAVSNAVEAELSGAGLKVERIAGADRYATSAAIAQKVASLEGEYFMEKAFLVRGDNFADGLAVSPLAYSNRIPVVLTQPTSLSASAANTITGLDITDVVILGSNAAVSDSVEHAVRGLSTCPMVQRVAGADRYETSQRIAAYAFENYLAWKDFVGVATGLNFPDALAGGVAAGQRSGVLALTDPNRLSPIWAGYLAGAYVYSTPEIQIYGGSNVVSDDVMSKLQEIFLD